MKTPAMKKVTKEYTEFVKILEDLGNRMDQSFLLEEGCEKKGIKNITVTDDYAINKFKDKYFETEMYCNNDGVQIGCTYEVTPYQKVVTRYRRV